MGNLLIGFVMFLWNKMVHHQKPITYDAVETPNRYMCHQKHPGDITHVFEVKQLKMSRTPKKPFWGKTIYQYEVTMYVFVGGEYEQKRSARLPEYCYFLFRNTKIPHVLAINAFLNTEIKKTGGLA